MGREVTYEEYREVVERFNAARAQHEEAGQRLREALQDLADYDANAQEKAMTRARDLERLLVEHNQWVRGQVAAREALVFEQSRGVRKDYDLAERSLEEVRTELIAVEQAVFEGLLEARGGR